MDKLKDLDSRLKSLAAARSAAVGEKGEKKFIDKEIRKTSYELSKLATMLLGGKVR